MTDKREPFAWLRDALAGEKRQSIPAGTDNGSWQTYVDQMKGQNPEQYLAGDLEGYRRGYTDGVQSEKQARVDWNFAGLILAMLLAGAAGFLWGTVL